jgi:hypothetical protein
MPPQSLVSIAIAIACQLLVVSYQGAESREQGGRELRELRELGRLREKPLASHLLPLASSHSPLTAHHPITNYQLPITNYHYS